MQPIIRRRGTSRMELRHLRYFVAVAESLHFGRAALQLRIAQPSLSHQIGRLEAELVTQLLARTKRHVELTDAGRLFLLEAKEIIAHADRAAVSARRIGGTDARRLRVGVAYCTDQLGIADLVGHYLTCHKDTQIDIRTMSVPSQFAALLDGKLDIGFVRPPVDDPTLSSEIVIAEPLVVALPRRHPLVSRARLPLSALANEPFVLPQRDDVPVFHAAVLRACREAGFVPHSVHEADHLRMVLGMVAAGAGVAIVPATARKIEPRRVIFRLPHPSPGNLETAIAWRRGDKSPVLAEFISAVKLALLRRA